MSVSTEDRAWLENLADELIPADGQMPSASQADVAGRWLDAVLSAWPQLQQPLQQLLTETRQSSHEDALANLASQNPDGFGLLTEVVCNAYFMNPMVREAVGYAGQEQRPIDPRPDYMENGLLESVIRRGPIYRPTPEFES